MTPELSGAFAHAQLTGTHNLMLPMPQSSPVSQLLVRCNQHYASLASSSSHKFIKAKKIFVNDVYEVVDHRSLIKEAFTDFMQVTVAALVKPKDEVKTVVETPAVSLPVSELAQKQLPAGKKFTREPTTMANFVASLKSEGKLSETPKR